MIVTIRVAGELLSGVVGAGVGGVVWVVLLLARNYIKKGFKYYYYSGPEGNEIKIVIVIFP